VKDVAIERRVSEQQIVGVARMQEAEIAWRGVMRAIRQFVRPGVRVEAVAGWG
jgi:hypothetical protein